MYCRVSLDIWDMKNQFLPHGNFMDRHLFTGTLTADIMIHCEQYCLDVSSPKKICINHDYIIIKYLFDKTQVYLCDRNPFLYTGAS